MLYQIYCSSSGPKSNIIPFSIYAPAISSEIWIRTAERVLFVSFTIEEITCKCFVSSYRRTSAIALLTHWWLKRRLKWTHIHTNACTYQIDCIEFNHRMRFHSTCHFFFIFSFVLLSSSPPFSAARKFNFLQNIQQSHDDSLSLSRRQLITSSQTANLMMQRCRADNQNRSTNLACAQEVWWWCRCLA